MLGQTRREIDRIRDQIAQGTISEEEARSRLPELRRRDGAQAELAILAPPAKMVARHPSTVTRATSPRLKTSPARSVDGGEEITEVVIHPADRDVPRIEIAGRSAKLTGANLFPQTSLITVVAGAGIEL
jgi:hypothetical protein